jgi:hypothetical protein
LRLTLAAALAYDSKYRTFAAGRTLEPGADFRQADAQFGHGAAKGIPVNAQLLCRLTLVSLVGCQHFAQILPFELSYGVLVADAGGMHLCNQAVQVSSHVTLVLY